MGTELVGVGVGTAVGAGVGVVAGVGETLVSEVIEVVAAPHAQSSAPDVSAMSPARSLPSMRLTVSMTTS